MATVQNVHGHDVIELILNAEPALSRAGLRQEVLRRWGDGARFYTCSAVGMTLDELLTFLLVRGKVVEHEGRLVPDMSKVCKHGEHDHEHQD